MAGKLEALCQWGEFEEYDLIALQETNMNSGAKKAASHIKQEAYKFWWVNGKESKTKGRGVGMLMSNWMWVHAGRTSTCGSRGQARDFNFKGSLKLRVINCYVPSIDRTNREKEKEINELTVWLKEEYWSAKAERREVIVLGDFNGVNDPRIDRRNSARNSNNPETDILKWLRTEQIHDIFRAAHPTKQEYTCQDVSRIDMIFTNSLLVDRLLEVKHNTVDGVSSDHKMVTAIISVHGLIQTMANPIKYKKPRGYRFRFRDTDKAQWNDFKDALGKELNDVARMEEFGLKDLDQDEDMDRLEDLRKVDIEKAWRWYSKTMLRCAKSNLPGKIVGKTGTKPQAELSIRHIVRDLGRIKQMATAIKQRRQIDLEDDARMRLIEEKTKFNTHAKWMREETEREMEDLGEVPGWNEDEGVWKAWIKGVQDRWTTALKDLQAERRAEKATKMTKWVEKRCEQLLTAPGRMIDKLLGRGRGKVVLDRIQVEEDGAIVNVLEPEKIKSHVREWFKNWHGPRPAKPLEPGSRWERQYAPLDWIEDEWYNGLMDPPTRGELRAVVLDAPKDKAPGVSGITNELFQHQGERGHNILFQIVGASIVQKTIPKDWKTGLLYCIPKTTEWSGNMAEVRPIALLEHARKIMFAVLTNRLSETMGRHNILRGPNFSVLKGTTTKDPIHILQAAMEDAREFKKEQWIVFQDMKRCFDSVNCTPDGMLSRGLRRLRVPEPFIRVCENIAVTKVNKVITEYGLTDDYHPECGLDQGGVECPLLWRIAYDPLLCEVMDHTTGYRIEGPPDTPQTADLAFVDDTTWLSNSQDNTQEILDVATSFYELNNVEINTKKTQVMVLNRKKGEEDHLTFGTPAEAIIPVGKDEPVRILGVWVTASGLTTTTERIVEREVDTICNILSPKAVTDKQTIYIINNVLIPRVLYRTSAQILTQSIVCKMTGKYMKLCKKEGAHALNNTQQYNAPPPFLCSKEPRGCTG